MYRVLLEKLALLALSSEGTQCLDSPLPSAL